MGRWLARAGIALVVLVVWPVPARSAVLEAMRSDAGPDGAVIHLTFSQAAPPRLSVVRDTDGAPLRLYLDLPSGTTVAPGVPRIVTGSAPVSGLRIGVADDGAPRVLVELSEAGKYCLVREHGGRRLTLSIARATGAPSATGPVAQPEPEPVAAAPAELGARGVKIVLDPGHGGDDPGAEGFAVEKHVTLAISRLLGRLLEERLGATVVLTRSSDRTLPLAARTARANREGADLFVSIHANASPRGRLHGVETYYLDPHGDHATLRLAKMENGLDLLHPSKEKAGLRYILSDLVQVGKMEESAVLARAVHRSLVRHLQERYPGVTDLGVKRGPFYVLVGAYMPCVLVEAAFLTHPVEGRRLARPAYREDIAEGLYDGIAGFVAQMRRARTL